MMQPVIPFGFSPRAREFVLAASLDSLQVWPGVKVSVEIRLVQIPRDINVHASRVDVT